MICFNRFRQVQRIACSTGNLTLLVLTWIWLAGCAARPLQLPQIEAAPGNNRISISVDSQPEQVVVAIQDPQGIGSAQFKHTGGAFPKRLLYQFYLKGLEQMQLAYGENQILISLSSQPGNPVSQSLSTSPGAPGAGTQSGQDLEPGSPYWLAIEIVPQGGAEGAIPLETGYIQVEMPPDFYQQQPENWSLAWVDFYR